MEQQIDRQTDRQTERGIESVRSITWIHGYRSGISRWISRYRSSKQQFSLSLSLWELNTVFRYTHTQVGKALDSHQTISSAVRQAAAGSQAAEHEGGNGAVTLPLSFPQHFLSSLTRALSCWPALSAKLPMMHPILLLTPYYLPAHLQYDLSIITLETG